MLLKNHECWEHPQAQRLTEKLVTKLYICNIRVTHMTSYIPTSLCLIEHWVSHAAELQPVKALAASSKLRVGWRYQPGRTGEVTTRLSQQLSKMPRNFEVKNILSYRVREAYNHRAMLAPAKLLFQMNLRRVWSKELYHSKSWQGRKAQLHTYLPWLLPYRSTSYAYNETI